jgi:hypothetical protein
LMDCGPGRRLRQIDSPREPGMGLVQGLCGGSRPIPWGDESEWTAGKPTPSRGSREGVWEREGGLRVLPGTGPDIARTLAARVRSGGERAPHPVRLFIAPEPEEILKFPSTLAISPGGSLGGSPDGPSTPSHRCLVWTWRPRRIMLHPGPPPGSGADVSGDRAGRDYRHEPWGDGVRQR